MITDKSNRILVAVDCSNFEYVCLNSAVKKWCDDCPDDSAVLKPAKETDQTNLPNLTVWDSFRRILSRTVEDRIGGLEWIVRNNHQNEVESAEGLDMVFVLDDFVGKNFRRRMFPDYKIQRKKILRRFDVFKVKDYIENVIFRELDVESLGFKVVKADGCESDDVISVMMRDGEEYMCRILISSDRDFCQIENVFQYDCFGTRVTPGFKHGDSFVEMESGNFLLWKILRGDASDNIPNVFPRCGEVTAYKLVKDKKRIKKMLLENREYAEKFRMNKSLIDMNEIPEECVNEIRSAISNAFETTKGCNVLQGESGCIVL